MEILQVLVVSIRTTSFNTKNCILPTECSYALLVVLTAKTEYFPVQKSHRNFFITEVHCSFERER